MSPSFKPFHLLLQALHPERNVHRFYEIRAAYLLFGELGVTLSYGRWGTKGRDRTHLFDNEQEAQKFIHKVLKKRLSSPRRIGCPYTLVKSSPLPVLQRWIGELKLSLLG